MEKIGFWYLDLRETTISQHLIDTVKKKKRKCLYCKQDVSWV